MGTYSKKKLLAAHPSQINAIAEAIQDDFVRDGFDVYIDTLMSGGKDISITKGNLFKAVLGMRSALKVTLMPQTDGILFDANVGIYGQQAIPTVISMLFFWPVLITQIWGLVEQASLDDRALTLAEQTIAGDTTSSASASSFTSSSASTHTTSSSSSSTSSSASTPATSSTSNFMNTHKFCTNCGTKLEGSPKFCSNCGTKLG